MNSLLLTLAALFILVLSALFAAPLFIDWNDYRPAFEEQATKLLGRDVKVDGKVHLILLPAPELKFDDVKARALAFVAGTLLASPYAMNYERLMMAPMLVAAMLTTSLAGLVIAIPLVASRVYAFVPSLLVSMALTLWTPKRSSGPTRTVEGG